MKKFTGSLLAWCLSATLAFAAEANSKLEGLNLPPLEPSVTSFGAAVSGDYLYVYGGHLGKPHEYNDKSGSGTLRRLKLSENSKWEELQAGPSRTGLAMVSYQGKLYRVGGFEAKNPQGKDWELFSTTDFCCFDPASGQWTSLTPLPAGRSSHDAAVIGSKLYVVGGWNMQGKNNTTWHTEALVCDLSQSSPSWEVLKVAPPFQRRALAVASWDNKLYVVGGMTEDGDMVTTVDVFDPRSQTWVKGPDLPGEGSEGFGVSAFASEKGLLATPRSGVVLRLDKAAQAWKEVSKLHTSRFFHRLVASASGDMVIVAGNAKSGKTGDVEIIKLP